MIIFHLRASRSLIKKCYYINLKLFHETLPSVATEGSSLNNNKKKFLNFIFAFLYVTMSLKLTLSSVGLFQIMTEFLKKEISMYCPLYLSPKNNFLFLVLISIWWLSYSML